MSDPSVDSGHVAPPISIIIAARNEAARLPARIRNLLSLDYPSRSRQIIVVDDGSTDHTERALEPFQGAIDLVRIEAAGKASASVTLGISAAT